MQNIKRVFEQIFFIFLICSPILDIATGIQFYLNSEGDLMRNGSHLVVNQTLSLSFIIRMIMLLIMGLYVLYTKRTKILLIFSAIFITWILTVITNFSQPNFDFMQELLYICKFGFNLLSLLAYFYIFSDCNLSYDKLRLKIDAILCWTIIIVSIAVIIPYFLGMGYYTYSDKLGYRGCRGFFFSGNDVTALLMLLLPLSFAILQKYYNKNNKMNIILLITPACCTVSLLIIGTKTAFLAIIVTYIFIFVYQLIYYIINKSITDAKPFILSVLCTFVLFLISCIITNGGLYNSIILSFDVTGKYAEIAGTQAMVFSGRTDKLKNAIIYFKSHMPLSLFFGISRGTQQKIIEMDIPEVVLYYGLLGTVTMLWLYIKSGLQVIYNVFKNFSYTCFCCTISLGLTVGYLAMAGHTLFSVTSGFYFAFVLLYACMFTSKNKKII